MRADPETVLQFWFGTKPDDAVAAREQSSLWWSKRAATDWMIDERFGALRRSAIAGELADWEHAPRSRLALIVLVDQFSRNIFRDTPEAFAHDDQARRWCFDGIARGHDRLLRPIERTFFYLPLEHSESRDDQARSVAMFEALCAEAPPELKASMAGYLDFARRHREIVDRFGRFPHRNRILGRESTDEERSFLAQPGSSF
jgi:uncharacterized protein (DUF924 family)